MSESQENQLIQSFCESWNEVAPSLLGGPSSLGLISLREAQDEGLDAALAVEATWPAGYIADCLDGLPGVVICLFKSEDGQQIEQLVKKHGASLPKPSTRALLIATLLETSARYSNATQAPLNFGEVTQIDLIGQELSLKKIVGDKAWVATISLSAPEDLNSQVLLIYAPNSQRDAMEFLTGSASYAPAAPHSASAAAGTTMPSAGSHGPPRPEEPLARNIERLLNVELEVIVRFGTTNMTLRDIVRLGTGMMIELNRGVDEPVELLVNDRQLARGEVVVIDGYYGVRITEIGVPGERASLLTLEKKS